MTSTSCRPVRVRFAPSPTGALHIGGLRTALFNYLFARQQNGVMVLRIEDTDQNRFVPGAEQYIIDALAWMGIVIDEGIGAAQEGKHAPYRQSERQSIYLTHVQKLIDSGHAYLAFDTADDLEKHRAVTPSFLYGAATRMKMQNSLTLPADEVSRRVAERHPYVVRFKIPDNQEIVFNDLIRGTVRINADQLDDKVLIKSDRLPTYHLANVVDDYLMQISHVIRGEEWLPSAPLHVLLYHSFGWEKEMPQFAHLPLLLKPDGKGKLSKRDADLQGFPIFPLTWRDPKTNEISIGFREKGYLPEGLQNFLALLGWNPGTEQEIFSTAELITSFSFERIQKSGAKFDIKKAIWFNAHYLRNKPLPELVNLLLAQLEQSNIKNIPPRRLEQIIEVIRERISFPTDLLSQSKIFFVPPGQYDEHVIAKKWNQDTVNVLRTFLRNCSSFDNLLAPQIQSLLEQSAEENGISYGKIIQGLRVALTGQGSGPDLTAVMKILGKEEVAQRIQTTLEKFPI